MRALRNRWFPVNRVLPSLVLAGVLGLGVYLVVARPDSDLGPKLIGGSTATILLIAIGSALSRRRARRRMTVRHPVDGRGSTRRGG